MPGSSEAARADPVRSYGIGDDSGVSGRPAGGQRTFSCRRCGWTADLPEQRRGQLAGSPPFPPARGATVENVDGERQISTPCRASGGPPLRHAKTLTSDRRTTAGDDSQNPCKDVIQCKRDETR